MSGDDARLREHFRALRSEESGSAPPFLATLDAARGSGQDRLRARTPWLLAAAAASGALLWLMTLPTPDAPPDFAVGGWASATDVLLATPGADLLRGPAWDPALALPEPTETGPMSRRMHGRNHG